MSHKKLIHHWTLPRVGKADVFKLEKREQQPLQADEVALNVHFSGLNFADVLMRQGLYPDAPRLPFTPGYEVSGVIERMGAEVQGLRIGQRVCAGVKFGGYSSQLNVASWQVMPVPDELSLDEAAGIPVSALTAYNALFELARVRSGDKVLLDCATGALGQMCCQLLKDAHVDLLGLTSSEAKKRELSLKGQRSMTHQEFENSSESGFQVAINSLGGRFVELHYSRLAPCGRLVCLGAADAIAPGKRNLIKALKTLLQFKSFKPIELMNDNKGVMGLNLLRLLDHKELLIHQLSEISKLNLLPRIDKIFSYEHLCLAHRYLEDRESRGKVLIEWPS